MIYLSDAKLDATGAALNLAQPKVYNWDLKFTNSHRSCSLHPRMHHERADPVDVSCSMRLLQRNLNGAMLLNGAATLEVIESYPNDKYLPSYLLRGEHEQSVFHAQAAVDLDGDNVRIVTMYTPEPNEWDAGFRIRRRH